MPNDDVLVLVPGILGSVLSKDGKATWQPSIDALWRIITSGRDLSALRLEEGSIDDPVSDGVKATGLIQDARVLPGLVRVEGYTRIAAQLPKALGIRADRFHQFAYDWRRDNRGTAKRLGAFVQERLKGLPDDSRCVLVCHSMGGLVARYWLEVLGGWRLCRALITVATPYRGAPEAVGFLCNGMSAKLGPLKLYDITQTLRTFTSIYQLLPIYPCVDGNGVGFLRVNEAAALPNLDQDRVRAAMAFHREIEAAVNANLADPAYRKGAPVICPVVGTYQPTAQSVKIEGDGVKLSASYRGVDLDGDGTVPRVSATPLELSDAHREVFISGRHSTLQNLAGVLDQVRGVVRGTEIDLGAFRGMDRAPPETRVALEVEDVFMGGEPVVVRARPSSEPVALTARVTLPSGRAVANVRLRRDAYGAHVASLEALPDGLYRVEVSGPGAPPVADVFAVVGGEKRRRARTRWSSSFVVVEGDRTFREVSPALARGPEYVIVRRDPGLLFAFEAGEVAAAAKAKPRLKLAQALRLREAEASPRGALSSDAPVEARGDLSSSGRLVAPEEGEPLAVGTLQQAARKARRRRRGPKPMFDLLVDGAPGGAGDQNGRARDISPISGSPTGEEPRPPELRDPKRRPGAAAETVRRYPNLEATAVRPGQEVTITADLTLEASQPGVAAIPFPTLAPGWTSFDVDVLLTCEQIAFEKGGRKTITVKRDGASKQAQVTGTVAATAQPGQQIELRARFFQANRYCGWATRSLRVEGGEPERLEPAPGSPELRSRFAVEVGAESAWLTVSIQKISPSGGRFIWDLDVSAEPRRSAALRLPHKLKGECDVVDPKSFVAGAFHTYERVERGEHVRLLEGFGERLYREAPACFKEAYAAMRKAFPRQRFPIQFISDDPHVPWEMMFVPAPEDRRSYQLSIEHPVARWLGEHEGLMRSQLHRGTIAAIAPRYAKRDALPSAAREVKHLRQKHGAAIVDPADKERVLDLLEGDGAVVGAASLDQIAVLHYAGHGEFSAGNAQSSALFLDGGARLEVSEVDREMVVLGRDSRALVFLNACQVGRTGAVLGAIGGWADALVNREFGAVVAPLWSVYDDDAYSVVTEFYSLVLDQRLTLAEALRRVRASHGRTSQTYQSYLLFGDVMARFQ